MFFWTSFDIELCTKEITSSWSKFDQGFNTKLPDWTLIDADVYIYIFPAMRAPVLGY